MWMKSRQDSVPGRFRGGSVRSGRLLFALAALTAVGLGCDRNEVTAAVAPPAEVTVSRPLPKPVTDAIELTGSTAAVESVEVRARVTGFLKSVDFVAPKKVKQGDVLFTIDPDEFKNALQTAEATLAATEAKLLKAKSDLAKVIDLVSKGAASEDERTTAQAIHDGLVADKLANQATIANAKLDLGWSQVTAPISGRISRNLIDAGNLVTADKTLLATIVNDDDVYAYFNGSERDVLTLRERTRAQVAARGAAGGPATSQPELRDARWPVYLGLMTETGYPHRGVLDYAAPEVDPGTGTIQVRGIFPNADGILLGGLFVRIRLPIGAPYEALVVTERALGSDQGQRYLLVVNDKNVVEYRPVEVGVLQEGLRVITKGLAAEDWVIVNGLQRVRPGLTVKPVQVPMPVGPAVAAPASAPAPGGAGGTPASKETKTAEK